jgi:hypothetical protein
MPKSLELNRQKGSILAGVLALSVAMTAVAGGYVLMAGNTAGRRLDSQEDLRLHYAAEAGMLVGVRWLKEYGPEYIQNKLWTDTVRISGPEYRIDNCPVSVVLFLTAGGWYRFRSLATLGDKRDTLAITLDVNSSQPGIPKSHPWTDNWQESYRLAKP